MGKRKVTDEMLTGIAKDFTNMTNVELCAKYGVSRATICKIQRRYKLTKSPEHIHAMALKAGRASDKARGSRPLNITAESIRKRTETYKETLRREYIRYNWGLEQKTKIRLKKESRQIHDQRQRLIEKGYIIDNYRKIAYYTEETNRSERYERRKKGEGFFPIFFTFKPYVQ